MTTIFLLASPFAAEYSSAFPLNAFDFRPPLQELAKLATMSTIEKVKGGRVRRSVAEVRQAAPFMSSLTCARSVTM